MLQVKIWGFNLKKPNGYTPEKMESVINDFMDKNKCIYDTFEMFELEGIMIVKVLYNITKRNFKSKKIKKQT